MALQRAKDDWLRWDQNEERRELVASLSSQELEKAMLPRIAFGTAGLRAEMGPGLARMNDVTVLQASQGVAAYVLARVEGAAARGVVIGHDHRHNSKTFAELTALAFSHKGFRIYYLGLVHTPSVPYTIVQKHAACGVMVTASHNPAADNGYKVYWKNGCQITAPHDKGIAEAILANLEPWSWDLSQVQPKLAQRAVIDEVYLRTLDGARYLTPEQVKSKLHGPLVYTPMHGVGLPYAMRALEYLGVPRAMIISVPEQSEPDPDFPSVKFPNPEEKGALDLAIKLADSRGATTVLANDPDADRFACALKQDGKWRQLRGDEVGVLLANFLLHQKKKAGGSKPLAVLNSTVSSQLLPHLAELYGVTYVETLTGFKWLGNKAIELENDGYDVILAYEEALGYMCGSVRDKDGISAMFVFVQVLLDLDGGVQTELDNISERVGYFTQNNFYFVTPGPDVTRKTFVAIRADGPPQKVGPFKITTWRDLTVGYDSETANNVPMLPVSRDSEMVTFMLAISVDTTARVTIRGSGTEPKIKLYIEARGPSKQQAEAAAVMVGDVLSKEWFSGLSK